MPDPFVLNSGLFFGVILPIGTVLLIVALESLVKAFRRNK